MPAPRKYPDELRQRATRMVFEVREQTGGTVVLPYNPSGAVFQRPARRVRTPRLREDREM
jgi:hypothetical protein